MGHSTVALQLHYAHVGRDRLLEISQVIDWDVGETLGVTSFARDGREMNSIGDRGAMKATSADRGKGVSPGSLLSTMGG